jgi:phosphatidylglycerophosphate synthase
MNQSLACRVGPGKIGYGGTVHRVQSGPWVGFGALVLILLALDDGRLGAGRLGAGAWLVGLGAGLAVALLLTGALARHRDVVLGPAGRITLLRAELVCAVAALAVERGPVVLLVAMTVVALGLDGVDGPVARRTGTVSALGARFDMEVDAFLILVLSAYVAPVAGWWVLLIGAARYLLLAAGHALPWLHGELPPRPWCKVVAVVQGVVLVGVASGVLPLAGARAALLVALVLLAESFGREVRDLWRLSRGSRVVPAPAPVAELVERA